MNIKTIEAMLEAERIAVDPNLKSYTVDEAFEELEKCSPSLHSSEAHRRQRNSSNKTAARVKLTGFVSWGRGRDSAPSQKVKKQ